MFEKLKGAISDKGKDPSRLETTQSDDLPPYTAEPATGSTQGSGDQKHNPRQSPELKDAPPATDPRAAYPPQARHTPAALRTLHIYNDNWRHTKISILAEDKETHLYDCQSNTFSKPHLGLARSGSNGTDFATAGVIMYAGKINMQIHGEEVVLKPLWKKLFTYTYISPSLGGVELSWRGHSRLTDFDVDLEDAQGLLVARLMFPNWAKKKVCRLELVDPRTEGEGVMDEIASTGLAIAKAREMFIATMAASSSA